LATWPATDEGVSLANHTQISPLPTHRIDRRNLLRKRLSEVAFEEVKGKSFELVRVVEMMCEVCEKPMSTKEKTLRIVQILRKEDLEGLLNRASVHDRAEVDFEDNRVYFYDHDFPGDVHPACVEKL
jgi:hypothetical protein